VQVHVKLNPNTAPAFAEARDVDRFGPSGYALFALQQEDRLIREGLKFQVTLTWLSVPQMNRQRAALNEQLAKAKQPLLPAAVSDITDDLRDAVWAWVNFGGLGSRTRRGCGALYCRALAPESTDVIAGWFRTAFERFSTLASSATLWPRLSGHLFHQPNPLSPIAAWQSVMSVFKAFRQGEGVGRNAGRQPNRPGRSRFPEPETIRETIRGSRGQRGGTHPPLGDIPSDAFPRAEFGLPIVFHFQGNEIAETVLYPRVGTEQHERMASPLVLRPLCLADGNAVPAIIPLDVPWFTEVDLTLGGRRNVRRTFPLSAVRRPSLAEYTIPPSPLGPLPSAANPRISAGSGDGSAIEAFLAFAQNADNNFRRV
ncbi:MAG: hypothetical protein ACRELF_17305, partial [Gemmataceae bacterium]